MKQIRKSLLFPILMFLCILFASAQNTIQLNKTEAKPLDTIIVNAPKGIIKVHDGEGRLYFESNTERQFIVSGALGTQLVCLHDKKGRELARGSFKVDCKTDIQDEGGRYGKLCELLKYIHEDGEGPIHFTDGKVYRMHSIASRDNVHAVKGAMYFMPNMKDGLDLHAKYQRHDGLIWDFAIQADPNQVNNFEWRFEPDFSRRSEDKGTVFARQPAENDVEHQFIRGIWHVWQSTGDDEWMKAMLDNALKAMRFSGNSEWFWSDKYKLLKRPYTIDTWDFVSEYDRYHLPLSSDHGLAKPGHTVYGIMHGDNTGMADACDKLAIMLEFAGRTKDANEAKAFAEGLRDRLNNLAWNGDFYTHHVSEDPNFERDFGVDESKQVSLSNTYALNRGIAHDKAVKIIQTYQRIRDEMPESSPAEFFMIYPPFQKGWGAHASAWQYTNGAVTGIAAGELSHGAFIHGYEQYGADILNRWLGFMEEFDNDMPWALRGKMPETPTRTFELVDLQNVANADLTAKGDGVTGWMDDKGMDMSQLPRGKQTFKEVPFNVIEGNNRKSLLRLARGKEHFAETVTFDINKKIGSVYFLHSVQGGGAIAGEVRFHYADGTEKIEYIVPGEDVFNAWSHPELPGRSRSMVRKDYYKTVTAWRGECPKFYDIGLTAHGMDNPLPDRVVKNIKLRAVGGGIAWLVIGITTSDAKAFFMPGKEGHGVPESWAAGALSNALFEGLAGVVDNDRNMKNVTISPRWNAADVNDVTCYIKYEDGKGYVAYSYKKTDSHISLLISGNSIEREVEILCPKNKRLEKVLLNGVSVDFKEKIIENSVYAVFEISELKTSELEIKLK